MNIENPNKNYYHGNKIVYSCQYHIIFVVKYRKPILNEIISNRAKEIFNQISKDYNFNIIANEVMPDHVHLLIECNPRFGINKVVKLLKGISSKILREEFRDTKSKVPCLWTGGYFVSTVGTVSLDTVKKYIDNQKI